MCVDNDELGSDLGGWERSESSVGGSLSRPPKSKLVSDDAKTQRLVDIDSRVLSGYAPSDVMLVVNVEG